MKQRINVTFDTGCHVQLSVAIEKKKKTHTKTNQPRKDQKAGLFVSKSVTVPQLQLFNYRLIYSRVYKKYFFPIHCDTFKAMNCIRSWRQVLNVRLRWTVVRRLN